MFLCSLKSDENVYAHTRRVVACAGTFDVAKHEVQRVLAARVFRQGFWGSAHGNVNHLRDRETDQKLGKRLLSSERVFCIVGSPGSASRRYTRTTPICIAYMNKHPFSVVFTVCFPPRVTDAVWFHQPYLTAHTLLATCFLSTSLLH